MNYIDIIQTGLIVVVLVVLLGKNKIGLPKTGQKKMILDSCALIDGRIIEVVSAGFAPALLIVPKFVLRELQLLADGSDSQKRERARFGLDVVKRLQENNNCQVIIHQDEIKDVQKTDDKLVNLAKKTGADLYTTDYNLSKVATVEGVRVMNINELAMNMRPVALPGEIKKVKIVQKGSNKNQGVGYLDDGTMVVVENAQNRLGSLVEVEISRYHQTESGKMLFGSMKRRNR